MKSTKETTHALIVRIWLETRELKNAEPIWRGVIENVKSGERVYFNDLDQVTFYLTSLIEAMGATVDKRQS